MDFAGDVASQALCECPWCRYARILKVFLSSVKLPIGDPHPSVEFPTSFLPFPSQNTNFSKVKACLKLSQDLTIQIDPQVTGFLKLPDLLDLMSRIIMERNYDAQIEDAFRC